MKGDENNVNRGVNSVNDGESTVNRQRQYRERRLMYCKLNMEHDVWR